MAERGAVARALLQIAGDVEDERALAEQVCWAYVGGLDVDGAAISLQTASTASQTLCATDATAELLEELQFSVWTPWPPGRPITSLIPPLRRGGRISARPRTSRVCARVWRCR